MVIPTVSHHTVVSIIGPTAAPDAAVTRSNSSIPIDPSRLGLKAAVTSPLHALPRLPGLATIMRKSKGTASIAASSQLLVDSLPMADMMSPQAQAAGGRQIVLLGQAIARKLQQPRGQSSAADTNAAPFNNGDASTLTAASLKYPQMHPVVKAAAAMAARSRLMFQTLKSIRGNILESGTPQIVKPAVVAAAINAQANARLIAAMLPRARQFAFQLSSGIAPRVPPGRTVKN